MRVGDVIDERYRITRLLGSGNYGRVFEAETASNHRVAIKVLREALLASPEERLRFEREASIMARLSHPNIVRVIGSGFAAKGLPYIVLELLEGRPLSEDLKRVGFMSATRVVGIVRQVLNALSVAHQHGLVHRDIKPSNIHLCHSVTAVDLVKVLDFGVAKPIKEGELEGLTEAGAMIGTPGYMSPEQIRAEPVGPMSDLFSVGMLMARLLSGERFVGETLMDVIRMHMGDGPIEVPRSVVLSELGCVVERALRKPPGERYQSAAEMLADLDTVMAAMQAAPTSASGTVLMPEHLDNDAAPNSTIPLEHMPWLDSGRESS